ncbi:MAG: STAS/SEC14 domain-containing protein [Polyangiales bacterium]
MLERLKDLPAGIDGVRASGTVTRTDYDEVVLPLFDEARRSARHLRLLFVCGRDIAGLSTSTPWEGLRVGVHDLHRIDRCAVVTDNDWVRLATRIKIAASFLWPFPIALYYESEMHQALAFLTSTDARPAMPHRLLEAAGVLVLEPQGPLRAEDFEAVAADVDRWIEAHGALHGVVIHARAFPGWENFAGLMSHLRFVRDHHRDVRRVALVLDTPLPEIAAAIGPHFIGAEMKAFAYDQFTDALAWAEQRVDRTSTASGGSSPTMTA